MVKCICCNTALIKYNGAGKYCPICYSVFTTDIPSEEYLSEYYRFYNEDYHGGGRAKGSKERQLSRAEKYLKIVRRFSKGKKLIDIGSSTNPFPNVAYFEGYNVTVVDYIKPKKLNPNIKFIESSLENLSVKLKYEVITALAIIEHTNNPELAINNLVNLCAINGILVINIPEIGRFPDKNSLGTSKWFRPPEHLTLLSKNAIVKLMKRRNCDLLYYSRFELNTIRYAVRYGIGYLEGCVGYITKLIFGVEIWSKIRQKRKSKYQGLSMFVFKRK